MKEHGTASGNYNKKKRCSDEAAIDRIREDMRYDGSVSFGTIWLAQESTAFCMIFGNLHLRNKMSRYNGKPTTCSKMSGDSVNLSLPPKSLLLVRLPHTQMS